MSLGPAERPSSAFVILSVDEAGRLDSALSAAAGQGFDGGLVVDNASTVGTGEVAVRHGLAVLTLSGRVPYTEAMNAGLARLLSTDPVPEVIALLQADIFLAPGVSRRRPVGAGRPL